MAEDRQLALEEAKEALLASWRADLADSFLNSTHTHSRRTTRLFWEWQCLDALNGKRAYNPQIDLLYEVSGQEPTVKLAAIAGKSTAKLPVVNVGSETRT